MTTPYALATSGMKARDEIAKVLRRLGCEKLGFMDDDAKHEVVLYFEHRGRPVRLEASAKGWAQIWLKEIRIRVAAAAHSSITGKMR
jgi:hypothetical protein